MITVKSRQFRDNILYYLDQVAKGHRVVLTRYNDPIAEIRPLPQDDVKPIVVPDNQIARSQQ